MYASWKARKSAFLFHPGILEGGTNHNSIQEKVQNSMFEKKNKKTLFIFFFRSENFFSTIFCVLVSNPTYKHDFWGSQWVYKNVKIENFIFLSKMDLEILTFLLLWLVPLSRMPGWKRKADFRAFQLTYIFF